MLDKKKASLGVLIVLSLITIGLSASYGISVSSSLTSPASSWSALRGVNYQWGPLGKPGLQATPPPSISFPMLKAEGFNFVRVEFGVLNTGEVSDPTNFFNDIKEIATVADANGLYVIYNQHHTSTQNDVGDFQTNWNQEWLPLLQIVDSHPSTLGYEPVNEPTSSGWNTQTLQQYYQFIANNIRSFGSSKSIVIMGQGSADMGYGVVNSQDILNLAPKGINHLVLDFHNYEGANLSTTYLNSYAAASKALGNVPVWIGEWAYDHSPFTVTSSQIPSIIQNYEKEFKAYGFASTYWKWAEGGSGPWSMLTTSGQVQSWVQYIVQDQGTITTTTTRTGTTTTTTSSATRSTTSSSSSSTTITSTTTSSISSSSSSLSSTTISNDSSFTSSYSNSSATSSSTQNSSTDGQNGEGQGSPSNNTTSASSSPRSLYQSAVGVLAALSPTKDPPVWDGFASYEFCLVGALGYVVMAFRRREPTNTWRW
jgi:hypothetical protein